MGELGQPYTSGNWVVRDGKQEEFIAAWTDLAEWSIANAGGAKSIVLIQQTQDSRRFLSFGGWEDPQAVEEWRDLPEFREKLGHCRQLCEQFEADDYRLVASREP